MPILVECPQCVSKFRVADQYAGKRGKCPRCQVVIPIPQTNPEDADLAPLDPAPVPSKSSQPTPLRTPPTALEADDSEGYDLAGPRATRRAKAAKVRQERLPGVAVSAEGVSSAAAATQRTLTPPEILDAFGDQIETVNPTLSYRLSVLFVAGVMLLLPMLYVALVGLVISAVYYHAVYDITIFQHAGNGRGSTKGAFLVYVAPLVAGIVVIAFMLKPLFARSTKRDKQRALDPEVEPLLFSFVDGVCDSVGAPRPNRIEVDNEVNAGVYLDGGALAVFRNELVLVIGLPLVAGLSLKEFSGVLAHEFGHFSQGTGMRLSLLIRSINHWFARVVYERDSWDNAIAGWSTSGDIYSMAIGGVVRLTVWLTRRVLWLLMWIGHGVSGFFSRQMEFDADRYEARMVGGRTFARTMWRIKEMGLAQNLAYGDLRTSWHEKRLPDNFPKLVVANVPQIPKDALAAYRKIMGSANTGWFDTHPCDKERIGRAKAEEPGEGIFHLDAPATDVFRNFDALARRASFDLYKSLLGNEISKDQLFTVAELVETQTVAQEGFAAAERFFLGAFPLNRRLPIPWDYPKAPTDPKRAKNALIKARGEVEASHDQVLGAMKQDSEIGGELYLAEVALVMMKAGASIKAADFELKAATPLAAEAARDRAEVRLRKLSEVFDPYMQAATERLTLALAILEVDKVANHVPDGLERREEARVLYRSVAHLGATVAPELSKLILARSVVGGMLSALQESKGAKEDWAINGTLRAASKLRDTLEELRWKVGDTIDYPFEHAREDMTLARYALPLVIPEKDDVGNLLDAAEKALERLTSLYQRALGRLALTAEEVERVLSLPPIEAEPSQNSGVS